MYKIKRMKILYRLLNLNLNHINIIEDLVQSEKSKYLKKLYTILLNDGPYDDRKAMLEIYGSERLADFSRLKSKLKEILIRTTSLQIVPQESYGSRTNEAHHQFRSGLVVKLLVDLKEHDLAIQIAERALKQSIKYHITELIIILLRILVRYYGSVEYNKYKLNKYLVMQDEYLNIHSWEIKAENYYID